MVGHFVLVYPFWKILSKLPSYNWLYNVICPSKPDYIQDAVITGHGESYRVPQGSILGQLVFTLYTTSLIALISSLSINQHLYADVTQNYMALSVSNPIIRNF